MLFVIVIFVSNDDNHKQHVVLEAVHMIVMDHTIIIIKITTIVMKITRITIVQRIPNFGCDHKTNALQKMVRKMKNLTKSLS